MKLYLDMDGVIADFVGGTCLLHGHDNPYSREEFLADYDLCKALGMRLEDFYVGMGENFWTNLPKTEWADEIVKFVREIFPLDHIIVLTKPTSNPGCIEGKKAWLQKHYPDFAERVVFANEKYFCAHEGALLIDDYDKNVDLFKKHGGKAILFKQPWNSSRFIGNSFEEMRKELDIFAQKFL